MLGLDHSKYCTRTMYKVVAFSSVQLIQCRCFVYFHWRRVCLWYLIIGWIHTTTLLATILLGQSSTKLTMWSNSSVYVWLRPITRRKSSSSNFSKFCKFTRRSHYLVLQSCQLFICGIMHVRLHARYLTLKTKCVQIDLKE